MNAAGFEKRAGRWLRVVMKPLVKVCFFPAIILAAAAANGPFAGAAESSSFIERVGSVFDDVARGLTFFGEKAQDLIGPGLGFGEGDSGGFTAERQYQENYPAGKGVLVDVANEFGQIRVSVWDNPVVQVTAKMRVRAESTKLADEIIQNIAVQAATEENRVMVRTSVPDTRGHAGKPAFEINYEIVVPRDANVIVRNDFGDTFVAGLGGTLAVDTRYGAIDLQDLAGPVSVRSRGEFGVNAQNLQQGGVFELHGARATFGRIMGKLEVSNFQGSVELRELTAETDVDVASESGPVSLFLGQSDAPDLVATTLFGDIVSDASLSRSVQGHFSVARSQNIESRQRISLRATFANIAIYYQQPAALQANAVMDSQPFKDMETRAEAVTEATSVTVDAIAGDVRIIGVDENVVSITANKVVRVQSQSNARAALQALNLAIGKGENLLAIKTAVTDNMAALGCVSYRIDLEIKVPRAVAVSVNAQQGETSVRDTGGNSVVRQASGTVLVEHAKGVLDLINQKGSIEVTSCAGPVEATTSYGDIKLVDIYGTMKTNCIQGKTIIEAPHAEVYARGQNGDIRVLSMETVAGNYDIATQDGGISILIPENTDASISVRTENGSVKSNLRLPGSVDKNVQEFMSTNTGPFRVTLQAKNGDVVIN